MAGSFGSPAPIFRVADPVLGFLLLLLVLGGCATTGESASLPPGTVQKGSLANQKLIRVTMRGVVARATTLGCAKIDSYEPYVVVMPEGAPGTRVWHERWIVSCSGSVYPIDIQFYETDVGSVISRIE